MLAFRQAAPDARVVLLTADFNLVNKCEARGIEAFVPEDALRLPEDPDETERSLAKAERELTAPKAAAPDLW